MKRNMTQWIDQMLAAPKKDGFLVCSFPAIQKMGITVKELISSSDMQAQAMKLVADQCPESVCSVSMMDLSVEAECFGSTIRFSDDEVPTVIGGIITDEDEADELEIPEVGAGRTQIYIDAIAKATELITDRPILAGVIGPFSLAGRLMDVTEALVLCYEEPEMVETVLEKCTTFLINYIKAYKAVGANGVVMAEPLAGMLSPNLEKSFSAPYVKRIIEAVQDDEFVVCYHNCGDNTVLQAPSIIENGSRLLHFGNSINMADMLPLIPEHILCMGNVDPANQLMRGTPASVKEATKAVMEACSGYKNFVVSSGCDVPPLSPWENIRAFYEAVTEYNA